MTRKVVMEVRGRTASLDEAISYARQKVAELRKFFAERLIDLGRKEAAVILSSTGYTGCAFVPAIIKELVPTVSFKVIILAAENMPVTQAAKEVPKDLRTQHAAHAGQERLPGEVLPGQRERTGVAEGTPRPRNKFFARLERFPEILDEIKQCHQDATIVLLTLNQGDRELYVSVDQELVELAGFMALFGSGRERLPEEIQALGLLVAIPSRVFLLNENTEFKELSTKESYLYIKKDFEPRAEDCVLLLLCDSSMKEKASALGRRWLDSGGRSYLVSVNEEAGEVILGVSLKIVRECDLADTLYEKMIAKRGG